MTNDEIQKVRAIVYDAYCEGDTEAEALLPILDAALAAPEPQPVARVTGYYAGRCVIEPLDGKSVFPTGMAVYSAPVAAQSAQPVAQKLRDELLFEIGNYWECAYWEGDSGISRGDQANKIIAKITDLIARLTAPPSRKWQGLTDEERQECQKQALEGFRHAIKTGGVNPPTIDVIVEAALRAKNSGEQA